MDRREALASAGAIALAVLTTSASAQQHDHAHHHHGAGLPSQALIDATSNCIAKGETCLAHCLVLLGDGDKAMAECARSVNQMLASCDALQKLATQGSRLVGAMAAVALDACTECEKACKKHADKHAECKACMEACGECIKQCKAIGA
jgi:Cys-rich four helix bundle protein (predicted Tat secretion target)